MQTKIVTLHFFLKNFKTLIVLLLLFSGISFGAIDLSKKATVVAHEIKFEIVSDTFAYPGRVRSKIESTTFAESEGVILKVLKPLGSTVKSGEVVLIMQNKDPVYQFAPVSVKASVSGLISKMEGTLESKIEKGAPLFIITDPKQLVVEVEIPGGELKNFKLGTIGTLKDKNSAHLKISGLSPMVDPKTGTATAKLEFTDKNVEVRPGEICQIYFKVNERKSIVLPSNVIFYKEGKPFVRLIENLKVKRLPVNLINENGGSVEIDTKIAEGAKVVLRANRFLADGDEIELEKSDASSEKSQTK